MIYYYIKLKGAKLLQNKPSVYLEYLKLKLKASKYFYVLLFVSEICLYSLVKHDEEQEFASIQDDDDTYMSNENDLFKPLSRRRTLRSHRSSDSSSNGTSDGSHSKAGSSRF